MPLSKSPNQSVVPARHGSGRSLRRTGIFDEFDDEESQISEDLMSVTMSDATESISSDTDGNAVWTVSAAPDRMKSLNEFANRSMLPEETDLMIRQFVQSADIPFQRTYELGTYVRGSVGNIHCPNVGLVILPGCDLPEVNRLEQQGMIARSPEQRNAIWRVNTAGSLLQNIIVNQDLNLTTKDLTKDVAAKTHSRMVFIPGYNPSMKHIRSSLT